MEGNAMPHQDMPHQDMPHQAAPHQDNPRRDRPDSGLIGRVHSLETFGTMDGPGIRFVLFLQGCPLRCWYCHNPDTWDPSAGREMSVEAVLAEIEPYLDYYWQSGGGITISGGEPALQAPFVAALLREAKRRFFLHTAIDTSGFCDPLRAEACGLLDTVDLVLLDLKLMDAARHEDLTGQPNDRILRFARHLSDTGRRMWIRHVLIPGVTDRREDLLALGRFLGTLRGVEKFELLPYHRMGVYKWQQLGIPYTLEGVREPAPQEIERAKRLIDEGRREAAAAGAAGEREARGHVLQKYST
jgi:pyruvate formate lyase activating enzyme